MVKQTEAICPLCQSKNTLLSSNKPLDYEYNVQPDSEFKIYACQSCGSEFLYPRPSVAQLIDFYPKTYHAYNEDHGGIAQFLVDARSKTRCKEYKKLVPDRDTIRLFDVGSGDCRHFNDLSKNGNFEFGGIDISPDMVSAAKKNGYDVEQGTLEDMDIGAHEEQWDIVTMYHLVEHVLAPPILLQKAFSLLRPGGVILGQLPCIDSIEYKIFKKYWAGYHFPRHLQMISKQAMHGILDQASFQNIEVTTALHLQAAISLQNTLVDRYGHNNQLTYGKMPYYSLLLLAMAPYCIFEWAVRKGGIMNFMARKPLSS